MTGGADGESRHASRTIPGDERREELGDGGAQVHRHVVHGEGAVDLGGLALVELGDEVRRVGFEQAAAHGDDSQRR